jgi:CheY-like chemotaxis protein
VIGIDPADTKRYRMLIVDDRKENRQLMVEWLTHIGIEVREANNGQEAIDEWERWEPHLIWMDMRMPVMDGYEATRRIKSTIKGQATVVIALTASAFEHEKALVLSQGCDDFVRKPARESLIMDKMSQHLGIKFVYEAQEDDLAKTDFQLSPSSLAALNGEQRNKLVDAIQSLDVDAVKAIIQQIKGTQPMLAKHLDTLVSQFRFDQLQELIG